MSRIVVKTPTLEPGQTRTAVMRVPLNRLQRRRKAAQMVKLYGDDLALMGLDPKQCRRDLSAWDGVSEETMPEWMREAKPSA